MSGRALAQENGDVVSMQPIDGLSVDDELVDPLVYHPMKEAEGSAAGLALRVAGIEPASLPGRLRAIAAALPRPKGAAVI